MRDARRGVPELPCIHPANFRVPTDWIEGAEPRWEEWKSTKARGRDGTPRVKCVSKPERIVDARYTPLDASSPLFQGVNPVRGLGLILYGLLRHNFDLPALWNGPGHAEVLGMLPRLLLGAMTCSSWTLGVLQGCLLPRVTENLFLRGQSQIGYADDDTHRDPPVFLTAGEVGAALRKCQEVLEQYQLSTLHHSARQLIPVSILQLTTPVWSRGFPDGDTEAGGES